LSSPSFRTLSSSVRLPLLNLFLENLNRYEKMKLLDGLETKYLPKGDFVFKEGDEGDAFYIIEEGTVECVKSDDEGGFVKARDLFKGCHFGEIALINSSPRSLGVRSSSSLCKLLCLGRETFRRILGNIESLLQMNYDGNFDKKYSVNNPISEAEDENSGNDN
jgi:CRP-like cAMP-binding protein